MIHITGYHGRAVREFGFSDDVEDRRSYFTVNCCGYEKYMTKSVNTLREHGRRDYQIIYMVRGSGRFNVGGGMEEVPQGNIVIYHPGEKQQYAYRCEDAPELYWAHFTGSGAYDFLDRVGLSRERVHFVGLHSACIGYFQKIILELQLKARLYEQAADTAMMELLTFMGRKKIDAISPEERNGDANIRKVMEQMHAQCNLNWRIEDFARLCNLSPNRFMHRFKARTGMPAMEYLIKIRMDRAKDLLLNSSLSVKEISGVVGYENPLYFSRLFKKIEGIPPKRFRDVAPGRLEKYESV